MSILHVKLRNIFRHKNPAYGTFGYFFQLCTALKNQLTSVRGNNILVEIKFVFCIPDFLKTDRSHEMSHDTKHGTSLDMLVVKNNLIEKNH